MGKKKIHVISNTHWDREWYLPLEKYQVRLVKLMDRLVDIMEKDEDYTFISDGQFVLIKDYLDAKPHMTDRVKALIEQKRLRIGPWYTQPLETLVTGEAMTRNLLYGIKESKKLGDVMLFSYMVDEFGHASQTPQVLKNFGIKDALAWRGLKNDAPAVFEWEAPDGESVIMHRSVHGYGEATALPVSLEDFDDVVDGRTFTRPGLISRVERIKYLKDTYAESDVQFWLNGIDHSWAQENLREAVEMVNKNFPEYDVKQSTLEEYAADIKKAYADNNVKLQKFVGELMHPDEDILVCIHSIRVDQKIKHYHAERILEKVAEPMHTIAAAMGMVESRWALENAWKYILENHAHDSLGCCSVDSVYEHIMARYTSSISLSQQAANDAMSYISTLDDDDYALYIFSTNSSEHNGAIRCSFDIAQEKAFDKFEIVDEKGNNVDFVLEAVNEVKTVKYNPQYGHPSFIMSYRYSVVMDVNALQGIGLKRFRIVKSDKDAKVNVCPCEDNNVMENEYFKVTILPNGCIHVFDKTTKQTYKHLLQIQDSGDIGGFYTHVKPESNLIITNMDKIAHIKLVTKNDLLTEYMISYTLDIPAGLSKEQDARSNETKPMDIEITLKLFKGARRIDVDIEVENRSRYHQLRVLFPTGIMAATTSLSGQPYDVVEREIGVPAGYNFAKDPNCEYHPMQDFCAIEHGNRGLAIASKGIFEYEAINDRYRTLALTLLRSTEFERVPDGVVVDYDTETSYLFKKIKQSMSIVPYAQSYKTIYPEILDFVNPPVVMFKKAPDEALLPSYEKPKAILGSCHIFVDIKAENVYVTAVKNPEEGEGLIVRVLSLSDKNEIVTITIDEVLGKFKENQMLNLNEDFIKELGDGNTASFTINPKQVCTVLFK